MDHTTDIEEVPDLSMLTTDNKITDKCVCGEKLEYITATKPKLINGLFESADVDDIEERLNSNCNYRTERQLFQECKPCSKIYETTETAEYKQTGVDVTSKTKPYKIDGLCRTEIQKYVPLYEGIITEKDELDITRRFMSEQIK